MIAIEDKVTTGFVVGRNNNTRKLMNAMKTKTIRRNDEDEMMKTKVKMKT